MVVYSIVCSLGAYFLLLFGALLYLQLYCIIWSYIVPQSDGMGTPGPRDRRSGHGRVYLELCCII
jgi:hypothetical protein